MKTGSRTGITESMGEAPRITGVTRLVNRTRPQRVSGRGVMVPLLKRSPRKRKKIEKRRAVGRVVIGVGLRPEPKVRERRRELMCVRANQVASVMVRLWLLHRRCLRRLKHL